MSRVFGESWLGLIPLVKSSWLGHFSSKRTPSPKVRSVSHRPLYLGRKLRSTLRAFKERGPSVDQFSELPLTPVILESLERMKYEKPTDVQARTIPLVLEGRDVLVTAQTGTGKTAAFAVPILQTILAAMEAGTPVRRALVLAPTRELAEQIGTVMRELTFFFRRVRYAVVIGGAPYGKQFRELGMDPAFVIGTPGRIIDHIETGTLKLDDFDFLVLDESDRMLDMGFAPQIEMIVKRFPDPRQTMMFSATLPQEVRGMVAKYLTNPARVAIGEENRPVARIQQDVIEVREGDKEATLLREIDKVAGSIIVFTKTRLKADIVAMQLSEAGHEAASLHGELTQGKRRQVTTKFRDGSIRILVATDIAARGLDIDHVRHVINYDLPMVPEDYVHRIGRTGRNGAEGHSVAFVGLNERQRWNTILRLMGQGTPGRADGRRNYKHSSENSAFSGAPSKNAPASRAARADRRAPFQQAYIGPREKDLAANAKSRKKESGIQIREVKSETARKPWSHKTGGGRAMKFQPDEVSPRSNGTRKPVGEWTGGFHSPQAKAVREQFQARVEKAESQRAGKLGRKPRFTPLSNGRPSEVTAKPSAKPHKGAPDTRKHKMKPRGKSPVPRETPKAASPWAGKKSSSTGPAPTRRHR
jgi:ATP-dependent RNA helicase DeaD